ncbi:hypothetical protein, partial [Bacteroides gallinarum]|uniref:hypothetical protein n=1 Tax=Bacteroides gallinarum TaxID=376806 RepID=UPI0019D007A5
IPKEKSVKAARFYRFFFIDKCIKSIISLAVTIVIGMHFVRLANNQHAHIQYGVGINLREFG